MFATSFLAMFMCDIHIYVQCTYMIPLPSHICVHIYFTLFITEHLLSVVLCCCCVVPVNTHMYVPTYRLHSTTNTPLFA